jgi:hypothetical protein
MCHERFAPVYSVLYINPEHTNTAIFTYNFFYYAGYVLERDLNTAVRPNVDSPDTFNIFQQPKVSSLVNSKHRDPNVI